MNSPVLQFGQFSRRLAAWFRDVFNERFDRSHVADVAAMAAFVRTRAAYVAQTALYGYLKTRMGTSFRTHFEDEVFSGVIRGSTAKLFASCLSDLAVFAVATAARDTDLSDSELTALARHCFRAAFDAGMADVDAQKVPDEALAAFDARVRATDWTAAAAGETAFAGSVVDLLRFAPVVDEFKKRDGEIVRNSIRFRWRDVREQFRRRVDGAAIAEDWRRICGA